ncbi:hypothetical protein JCM16358_23140 [Halanaerocella petrolearia]
MISLYKDYLKNILNNMEYDVKIYEGLKKLGRNRFPTPAAFIYLSEDEDLETDGELVSKEDDLENKMRYYTKRVYKVTNYIYVLFVAKEESDATELRNKFLAALDKKIQDSNNNKVEIEVNKSSLHLTGDILKKKVARELLLEFEGGIYTTKTFKLVDLAPEEGSIE